MKKNIPPLEDRPIKVHDCTISNTITPGAIYPPTQRVEYGKFIEKTDMQCAVCEGYLERRIFTFNYRTRKESLEMLACAPCFRQASMTDYEPGGAI